MRQMKKSVIETCVKDRYGVIAALLHALLVNPLMYRTLVLTEHLLWCE